MQPFQSPRPLSGPALQFSLLVVPLLIFVAGFTSVPTGCGFGLPVSLPFAPHAPSVQESDRDILVSIRSDGTIYIENRWFPLTEFDQKIRELGARARNKRLVLQAASSLSFSSIRSVLRPIRASGFTSVLLLTFRGHPIDLMRLQQA